MGKILHGSATMTEATGRAIQNSEESLRALSALYGTNQKPVAASRFEMFRPNQSSSRPRIRAKAISDAPNGIDERRFHRLSRILLCLWLDAASLLSR